MQNLYNLYKKIDGYKTHLVAVATVLYGLYQAFIATGGNWHTLVPYLLSGTGLSALRVAVAKVEVALTTKK
jgi:hypothetical protein